MEFLVIIAAGVAGMMAWSRMIANEHQRELLALAESAGLTAVEAAPPSWLNAGVVGQARGLDIRIFERRTRDKGLHWIVEITSPDGTFNALDLRPESVGTELEKRLLGAREIDVGDDLFDAAFFVDGAPAVVRALLDAETRALLRERIRSFGRVEIRHGVLRAVGLRSAGMRLGGLPDLIDPMLEAGERLAGHAGTEQRLAHNALWDPLPSVRLLNLIAIVREFLGSSTRPTLLAACQDASAQVRLQAASALGSDGVPTLLGLAQDPTIEDEWQAEAIRTLGRRFQAQQAESTLAQSLRSRHLRSAARCLHVLGSHGAASLATLQKVLAVEQDEGVAAAAAAALGATGVAHAEEALLSALEHTGAGVRRAAAEALGRVGSAAAVLPLKEMAERETGDLARSAREAVAAVQSRLGDASPGQLSLAAAETGQVSLAQAEAGQVSLPAAESGGLSLEGPQAARDPSRDRNPRLR